MEEQRKPDIFKNKDVFELFETQYNGSWYYLPITKNKEQDYWAMSHLLKYFNPNTMLPFNINIDKGYKVFVENLKKKELLI
jgi:hypothetical protein